jgi:hypothetical protein
MVNATFGGGTQGEGRYLIDKNPAKTITTGQLVSAGANVFTTANFTGTNFPVSVFLQLTAAATSQAKDIAPGTVTLPIATSGVPAGFAVNTNQLPGNSGVACVADTDDSRFPNFEMVNYTVVDASHITLTLNKVHGVGAVIAAGGLCGYGLEQTVDTTGAIRQVFPVVGAISATSLYYASASTPVVGFDGNASTSGFLNVSGQITSLVRSGNVVTATLSSNLPFDLSGLTMAVSGAADPSYNGSFQMTSAGGSFLTYPNVGPNNTSSGGTISFVTGGYVLYPMAEVLGVYDAATRQVDGLLKLGANTVAWAPGDAVEEPHFYQDLTAADTELITQYMPRPIQLSSAGKQYAGQVGPGMRGWQIQNTVPASNYLGAGGTHQLPDDAYVASGPWSTDFEVDAGTLSLIRSHCNIHGCNRWDSGYSLFALDSATGEDFLFYEPNASTAIWNLAGQLFTFAPSGFTANNVNTTALATTTFTAGYQGAVQLAPVGTTGYSNFTLDGNNNNGSRLGFVGGGAGDPSLYIDVPSGGQFDFRVNNVHNITLTADAGGTVETNVLQTQQVTGTGTAPTVAAGSAAGSGASATVSGTSLSGVLSVTTGASPVSGNTLASIGWTLPSTTPPRGCSLMPRNAAASAATGTVFTGARTLAGGR